MADKARDRPRLFRTSFDNKNENDYWGFSLGSFRFSCVDMRELLWYTVSEVKCDRYVE